MPEKDLVQHTACHLDLAVPSSVSLVCFFFGFVVAKVFTTVLVPLAAVAHSTTTPSLGGNYRILFALVLVLW